MFGKNPHMTPLELRKQLLIAESELNRVQLAEDIQNRTTEDKDEYGASEDERTQASSHESRQPPQRQPSAILHRLFRHPVL